VKKLEEIPKVLIQAGSQISCPEVCGAWLGRPVHWIWPSPKSVAVWIDKNWKPHLKGRMSHSFCGRGFFVFLFEEKEDRDLIFRKWPLLHGGSWALSKQMDSIL
jgi:hypothetical protein